MSPRLLFLNGSVRGSGGNTGSLIAVARRFVPAVVECETIVLAEYEGTVEALAERLRAADAFVFATGVYWSSWGSPLQRFFEVFSAHELDACFFGKPAGALVNMDSVGGADVAQRLLGVLGWFGCLAPPLASVVVSRVGTAVREQEAFEDVFQVEDVEVLIHNLLTAASTGPRDWRAWPITRTAPITGPYPHSGPLEAGLSRFGRSD